MQDNNYSENENYTDNIDYDNDNSKHDHIDVFKIEENMKSYAKLYNKKKSKIYNQTCEQVIDNLYNNLDTMHFEEKYSIYKNIITENNLDLQLLKFEMENIDFNIKIENLNDIINKIYYLLDRYKIIQENLPLEDEKWTLHTNFSKKYELNNTEIIFDNSVEKKYINDISLNKYIKKLVNLFSKISNDYKVNYKFLRDHDEDIIWILIKITLKK